MRAKTARAPITRKRSKKRIKITSPPPRLITLIKGRGIGIGKFLTADLRFEVIDQFIKALLDIGPDMCSSKR